MLDRFTNMRTLNAGLDFTKELGPVDLSYHSVGIGGVHPMPMPDSVVAGMKKMNLPIIRIFIQEFFFIYKDGQYDFTALDAYMDAVHATGADIMASICIKPHDLYPVVDENVYMPSDIAVWQAVIRTLVHRYSIAKQYVTHWALANETNIGETGGCPFKIMTPEDYFEYYKLTLPAIVETAPNTYVGGPSIAGGGVWAGEFLASVAKKCKDAGLRYDFAAYNTYVDDPISAVKSANAVIEPIHAVDPNIKVYVTELNVGIGNEISVEDKAYDAKRAASLAATLLEMHDHCALAGTFQYHAFDQFCDPNLFKPFYAIYRYMTNHWNDEPHRLGLFDLEGNVRPQYFMYRMLHTLASNRFSVTCPCEDVRMIASKDDGRITIFASNFATSGARDTVVHFHSTQMPEGLYRMKVTRVAGELHAESTELAPYENRLIYAFPDLHFAVHFPANSVSMIEFVKQ